MASTTAVASEPPLNVTTVSLDECLAGLPVARDAEIDDGLDLVNAPDSGLEGVDGRVVRRGQAAITSHDECRRRERRVLEGRGHRGRLHARRVGRQEAARGVLRHVAKRRQIPDGKERDHDPGQDDEVSEPDREASEARKEVAHGVPFWD